MRRGETCSTRTQRKIRVGTELTRRHANIGVTPPREKDYVILAACEGGAGVITCSRSGVKLKCDMLSLWAGATAPLRQLGLARVDLDLLGTKRNLDAKCKQRAADQCTHTVRHKSVRPPSRGSEGDIAAADHSNHPNPPMSEWRRGLLPQQARQHPSCSQRRTQVLESAQCQATRWHGDGDG